MVQRPLFPFDVAATACPLDAIDATPRRDTFSRLPRALNGRKKAAEDAEERRLEAERKKKKKPAGERSQEKGAREAPREDARRAPGPGGQGADEGPRQGRRRRNY